MAGPAEAFARVDVVVVGGGLAGAAAAQALAAAGRRVVVLDKGRGPGGRLSTRRTASGSFDHGAPYLQAHGGAFRAWLQAEQRAGRAASSVAGWVGLPGMNALVAGLLEGLDTRWSMPVAALGRDEDGWWARSVDGALLARAPAAVLAIPAPQAVTLLREGGTAGAKTSGAALPDLIESLASVRYAPCCTALVVAAAPRGEVAVPGPEPIAELVREAAKPGRSDVGHWVMHAGPAWSEAHVDVPVEALEAPMRALFSNATGIDAGGVQSLVVHRWRYARPTSGLTARRARSLAGFAYAGDAVEWRAGDAMPDAERAWRAGRDAAAHVLATASQPKS